MTTRMLINATVADELRIAIVEDGELTELDIETTDQNQIRGNIYKGIVHNVEQSLAAAFVDIGGHKQGFLPFSEVDSAQHRGGNGDGARITDVLKRGQELVVQVMKDAIGEKGATLTTHLSIPGRFTVLMPGSDAGGVSRKIEDETARKKIKAIASKITRPDDCGFIVRTAGLGQTKVAIQKDLDNVVAIWEKVQKSAQIARAPSLLYAEPDLISRTLRDFFSEEIDEVWIDSREEYEAARKYFEELMPQHVERIQWYQNPIPIFAYYHVEEQIEATFHRHVALPSGGSIVIDETEALVAIDVNSGKNTSEKDHEDTVYKTNLEAAEMVATQLKLRDLGGIIVIDFIDMELSKNERLVEKALADAAKLDKARYKISKINAQGLCVLTRQRIRQGMRRAFQRRCQTCAGTGWIRTPESHSLSLLRRVETRLAQGGVGEVRVTTHRETAEYIQNYKRAELMGLEREYHCRIVIFAKPEMDRNADDVVFLSKGEMLAEITDRLPPREERREMRSARRKRKKKRELAEGTVEGEASEGGEEAAAPTRAERMERKRKRRERDRDRDGRRERREEPAPADGVAASAAPPAEGVTEEGAAPASPAPRRERDRDRPRDRSRSRDRDREPAREGEPEGRFDGTGTATFTGRPPPEVLERLKAERRARLNARSGGRPQVAGSGGVEDGSADRPAAPSITAEAPEGAVNGAQASTLEVRRAEGPGSPEVTRDREVAPIAVAALDGTPRSMEPVPLVAETAAAGAEVEPAKRRDEVDEGIRTPSEPAREGAASAAPREAAPKKPGLLERLGVLRSQQPPPPTESDV